MNLFDKYLIPDCPEEWHRIVVDGMGTSKRAKCHQFCDTFRQPRLFAYYLRTLRKMAEHHRSSIRGCLQPPKHRNPPDYHECTSFRWSLTFRLELCHGANSTAARANSNRHSLQARYCTSSQYHCQWNSETWMEFALQAVRRHLNEWKWLVFFVGSFGDRQYALHVPASINSTFHCGTSESREAITDPPEPPPTTMKS